MSWLSMAACAASVSPDSFFPDSDGDPRRVKDEYCTDCPVRDECLRYALEHRIQYGIWGGMSEKQRRRLVRARRR